MDPAIGGALIGAGTGLLGDLFNYGQQARNLRYQKSLQREVFAREDTAVQRRVADLRAAGLSPTLAAGSAAASGATIGTTAPQMPKAGDRAREAVMGALEMKTLAAGLRKVQAETGRTEADTRRMEMENSLLAPSIPFATELFAHSLHKRKYETDMAQSEDRLRFVAAEIAEKFGVRQAEALTLVREIERRVSSKAEEFGSAPAKGIMQWLPLFEAVMRAATGR